MGKFIYSTSYTLATDSQITMRTNNASYPKVNVMDLWHPARCARAADVTANDWFMKIDFGAAKSLQGVILNDVNFNKVVIQGHATDAWGGPSYASGTLTVSKDTVVDRYKIYIPLTGFNYRWLRIFIPAGTTEVGTGVSEWLCGSIMFMDTVTELSKNMSWGYKITSNKPFVDIKLSHGGFERVKTGDRLRAFINVPFKIRNSANEAELWTLNALDSALPMTVYENIDDNSRAYICIRDNSYESKLVNVNQVLGNTIKFKELV